MFPSSQRYGRMVRSALTVPMVTKVLDGFDETFNFSFSWSRMQYGRVVRSDTTIPMVVKVTGTCEHQKFMCNLHVPLCINITSKMAKEKQQYISRMCNH
jgi:hypothetical protein